jgi:predicted metal-dependent hydrolase
VVPEASEVLTNLKRDGLGLAGAGPIHAMVCGTATFLDTPGSLSREVDASEFAHHSSRGQIKPFMSKGERISRLVRELEGEDADVRGGSVANHPCYRAYFRCWNGQRYYEAHDVLEQLWLNKNSEDDDFFKGLIQAAGAFVHLQKNFQHPLHAKHGRRLRPAVRLFRLAEKNLSIFRPRHHSLDVTAFCQLLRSCADSIVRSDYKINPWSPETAPKLKLNR